MTLGMVLLEGPRRGLILMSEAPLHCMSVVDATVSLVRMQCVFESWSSFYPKRRRHASNSHQECFARTPWCLLLEGLICRICLARARQRPEPRSRVR